MDTVLFKTRRGFDGLKNRFRTFNAANHDVLLSLFILISSSAFSGVDCIFKKAKLLCVLETYISSFIKFPLAGCTDDFDLVFGTTE